jgi:MFS family permease
MYGAIFGPSLSPVIGGLLSQHLGWHSVFWFLSIVATIYLLVLVIFLPETCRNVVGDGSIKPPWYCRSLWQFIRQHRENIQIEHASTKLPPAAENHRRRPSPRTSLRILFSRTGSIPLLSIGLLYASFYIVITAIPSQFASEYGFDNVHISLIYIPLGLGSLLSALTTGPALNRNYRRHAARLGYPVDRNKQHDLSNFPVERARLEVAVVPMFAGAASTIGFGWAVETHAHLSVPVILIFIAGWGLISGFQCMSSLLIDMHGRKNAASASAANNLVRCSLAAIASAVVIPLIDAVGMGWACTIGGAVWLAVCPPAMLLLASRGKSWRAEARLKERN